MPACPFTSPLGAMVAIRDCAAAHLRATEQIDDRSEILLGREPTAGRDCCVSMLSVELNDDIEAVDVENRGIDGCGPCEDAWKGEFLVRYQTCVEQFAPNSTDAVAAATQNAQWQTFLSNAWSLVEALKCCICPPGPDEGWEGCEVRVFAVGLDRYDGACAGYHVKVEVHFYPCCRGELVQTPVPAQPIVLQ